MAINQGLYCLVNLPERDEVLLDPQLLPDNWKTEDGRTHTNTNNTDVWSDPMLLDIGWYPYNEIDPGPPEPLPKRYIRSFSDFVIQATTVDRTVIYTEFTQEQYDRSAQTTIKDSQRVAANLAQQTEQLLLQNTYRNDGGKTPLIPANDLADVQSYLGDLYDAVDDITGTILPDEPPGPTRQLTEVPGENVDRCVIRRRLEQFGGFDYWEIECTLYTEMDATGFSIYIQYQSGTFLFTLPLVDQGNGVWFVSTDKNAGMANRDDFAFAFYKGQLISQRKDLPPGADPVYPLYFDVRWLNGATLQQQIQAGEFTDIIF